MLIHIKREGSVRRRERKNGLESERESNVVERRVHCVYETKKHL